VNGYLKNGRYVSPQKPRELNCSSNVRLVQNGLMKLMKPLIKTYVPDYGPQKLIILEVNKQRRASAHEELLELEVQKHK
jgi:hypothetical protein